jgi:outer membrane receptor protein involved in Fe transport
VRAIRGGADETEKEMAEQTRTGDVAMAFGGAGRERAVTPVWLVSWATLVFCAAAWSCQLLCASVAAVRIAPEPQFGEEIVVTAQRRPERPQDIPISLTALAGDGLEQMQATDMAGLGKVVPSLVMTRTGAFTQPYLRGIGKRSTLGVENSVATYVDGVYLASPISALLDLRGVERIEVLNGPQGTLFGRNTTGGVIQIVTRDPTSETSGEAELHAGSYGNVRGDAYLTGGNDRIAGNFAMSLSHNGGYGTNLFTGKTDQGEVRHSFVARSKWIWKPAPSLKLTLAGDYQDVDQDFAYRPVAGFAPIGQPRVHNFRDGDQDAPSRYRFRYGGISLKGEAEIGKMILTSISALRRMRARYSNDLDLGPRSLLSAAPKARQEQFNQEFQLRSGDASRLPWVAGLYFIHIAEQYDPNPFFYGGSYSAQLGGRTGQVLYSRGHASSYAAYGQATLPIGQATALTLGLRYTIEQRSDEANGERQFDNPPFVRPIPGVPLLTEEPLRESIKTGELTWRASLERHFSDEVMGYASASRGFQSGGWNLQTPQNAAFGPERLDDFEAGLKYVSRSQRLSADTTLFRYDYSDLQVTAVTPTGSATTNATSARVYGLGLQLDARLDRDADVSLGLQLLKTRFNRFPNASCINYAPGAAAPYASISCDVTGNHLPFAPSLKFNVGANRRFSLGRAGALLLSANLAYNKGYFSEPDNVVRQDAFATVDVSAEWRASRSGPSVRLSVLNLTDCDYYDGLTAVATAGAFQRPAAPRRLGVSIAYDF